MGRGRTGRVVPFTAATAAASGKRNAYHEVASIPTVPRPAMLPKSKSFVAPARQDFVAAARRQRTVGKSRVRAAAAGTVFHATSPSMLVQPSSVGGLALKRGVQPTQAHYQGDVEPPKGRASAPEPAFAATTVSRPRPASSASGRRVAPASADRTRRGATPAPNQRSPPGRRSAPRTTPSSPAATPSRPRTAPTRPSTRASTAPPMPAVDRFASVPEDMMPVASSSDVLLRTKRAALLKVRKRLQDHTYTHFKSIRALMCAFDLDRDGIIGMDDWRAGLKLYSFPVTDQEAEDLFFAIDRDCNEDLDYKELCAVLEPATHTSFGNTSDPKLLEDHSNFTTFTRAQARVFRAAEAEKVKTAPTKAAMNNRRELEKDEAAAVARQRRLRKALSVPTEQELRAVQGRLVKQLASKSDNSQSTMFKVSKAMADFDPENKGFIMGPDLVRCLIENFGIRLEPEEYDWVRWACTDETDVALPKAVAAFIAKQRPPTPPLDPKLVLLQRLDGMLKQSAAEHMEYLRTVPRPEDDPPPLMTVTASKFKPTENTPVLPGTLTTAPTAAASDGADMGNPLAPSPPPSARRRRPATGAATQASTAPPDLAITRMGSLGGDTTLFSPVQRTRWSEKAGPRVVAPMNMTKPRATPRPATAGSAVGSPPAATATATATATTSAVLSTAAATTPAASTEQPSPARGTLASPCGGMGETLADTLRRKRDSGSNVFLDQHSRTEVHPLLATSITGDLTPKWEKRSPLPTASPAGGGAAAALNPSVGSALYASPADRLVRKSDHTDDDSRRARQRKAEVAAFRFKQAQAAEARIQDRYKRETMFAMEQQRRAVMGKARQMFNYTDRLCNRKAGWTVGLGFGSD